MMESWVVLALLAPLFFSISNITDKLALRHVVSGYLEYMFFGGVGGAVLFCALLAYGAIQPANVSDIAWCLLAGVLTFFLYFFYSYALEEMEVSSASALHQSEPLFVLVIELALYDVFISNDDFVGFFIILLSALLLTTPARALLRLKVDRNFYIMMISTLFGAVATIILDQVLERIDLWTVAGYQFAGYAMTSLAMLLVPHCRKEIAMSFRSMTVGKIGVFVMNDVFDMAGYLIFMSALLVAPSAAMVSVVITVEPIYVLLLSTVLSLVSPALTHEKTSLRAFFRKGLLMASIVLGIYLLNV